MNDRPQSQLRVRVDGPDGTALSAADLRRVFRGVRFTPARRTRLDQGGRVVARLGSSLVGVAAFERAGCELRVYEMGVDSSLDAEAVDEIVGAMLDALEVACMAGGGRRLVVLPRAAASCAQMRRRGFAAVAEGCAGSWFEKTFN
ncbi:MAG: hypothetical protein ACE148_01405 [Vicinamibacterales bacterium]